MSVQELKRSYDELSKADQILFASLIAADQMVRQGEFEVEIFRRHEAMNAGKKWTQDDVARLHEELKTNGL